MQCFWHSSSFSSSLSLSSSSAWFGICHPYGLSVHRDGVIMWPCVNLCLNLPFDFHLTQYASSFRALTKQCSEFKFSDSLRSHFSQKGQRCLSESSVCSLLFLQGLNRYLQPLITMIPDNHCSVPNLFFREKKRLEKAAVYLPITQFKIFGAC